jgi:hypothetical protein
MVRPRWMRHPMLALISFAVKASSLIIFWWHPTTLQTCSRGCESKVGKSWLATPGLPSVLWGGLLIAFYFLPPSFPRELVCFLVADMSMCQMLEGGCNHIEQDCLFLLCALSEKWGCWCSHWLCLVGWGQFQQSARGLPQMGSSHLRIMEGGQGVDLFQTASLGPNYCCILLQLWDHRWFLILYSIRTGLGFHQKWVEGSSLQVLALGVALLFLLRFCCEGGGFNMLTWSHPPLPWFID